MAHRNNAPGCCCCQCAVYSTTFPDGALDLWSVPVTGVSLTAGVVTVTESDKQAIATIHHHSWPYSMRATAVARVKRGAIFRLYVSWVDADNYLAIDIEPDTVRTSGCQYPTVWLRFYQVDAGTETLLGNELIYWDYDYDEDDWLTINGYYDHARGCLVCDIPEISGLSPLGTSYLPTEWTTTRTPGAYAGFGSGTATATETIEVTSFELAAIGTYAEEPGERVGCPGLVCDDAEPSCTLAFEQYNSLPDGDEPCTFESTSTLEIARDPWYAPHGILTAPGNNASGSADHRIIINDSAIAISVTFTLAMLSAINKWTEFSIIVDGNEVKLRVTRITPPTILYKFALRFEWSVNSGIVKTENYYSSLLRDNAIGGYVVLCVNGSLAATYRITTEAGVRPVETFSAVGVTAGVIGLSVQQPDDDDGTGFDVLLINKYNNYGYYYSGECGCT